MPKAKRIRSAALKAQLKSHQPLGQVLEDAAQRKLYVDRKATATRTPRNNDANEEDEMLLDTKTSQRILSLSREQKLEVETEQQQKQSQKKLSRRKKDDSDDDDDGNASDPEEWDGGDDVVNDAQSGYVEVADGALTAEDEALINSMMQPSAERRTLADMILEKIEQKQAQDAAAANGEQEGEEGNMDLPPKVVHVYTEIGVILSRYTSGKLPKAFKVIPALTNWEEVLYLTRPDRWTPQAMYAATRIFASNLNPHMAQRFYNLVLLDAVRADIHANKKLNYHYYMALKKAIYKPAAFLKGILLALCREQCTLREATIVASVLQRVSIPVHHSAVAIHKLASFREYTGATSIFLRALLNKKYSLPSPVVSSLVGHFASFVKNDTTLPVLWHQSLLVFVQRYKLLLKENEAAREALRLVMKKHYHAKITPEIRRELFGGVAAWKEDQQQRKANEMEM